MYDEVSVLVIGGGPGGSTAAALLAKDGIDVLLLEREEFPRYHIGESLLPACVPTLQMSGAIDAVAAHGFQVKRGGVFRWGKDEWILDWDKMVDPPAWSWEVDRAEYDHILLRNASAQGAQVVEKATVRNVVFDGDRPVAVEWVHDGGDVRTTRFRYLIDASGRTGVLAKQHLDIRTRHDVFQNVAIWAYWDGAGLLPGNPEGGINVVTAPDGWWWNIPLAGNRHSVGLVTHKDDFGARRPGYPSLQDYYLDRLHGDPTMHSLVEGARFAGPVRAEQDYSYAADRFCGPGYVMVGDAACFLDPLLSTGVHLAQYSATLAAAAIATAHRGEMTEQEALGFFEFTYRRAYTRMLVLVGRLYQKYEGASTYFTQAQQLVHEDTHNTEPIRDFTGIITGLTDMREAEHVDLRVLTRALIHEAEQTSDSLEMQRCSMGLDLGLTWAYENKLFGADAAAGDIHLSSTPRLGLRRQTAPEPAGRPA